MQLVFTCSSFKGWTRKGIDSAVFTTVVVVVVVVMVVVVRVAVFVPKIDKSADDPSCRLLINRLLRPSSFLLFLFLTQIISVETDEH